MPSRRVRGAGPGTTAARASSLLVVLGLTAVAGCTSGSPVELNQTRPPVTVTVTTTVTPPPTSTPAASTSSSNPGERPTSSETPPGGTASVLTARPSTPPTVSPPVSPPASGSGTSSPGAAGGGTQARLVADYQALIRAISVIDALPPTGAATGSALDDLAGRFRALRATPVPAKVDRPSYVGRLFSLELFAAAAADEARASSPQAVTRYGVIRAQTATLLALVDGGLGTALTLAVPGASPSPTSGPQTTPPAAR